MYIKFTRSPHKSIKADKWYFCSEINYNGVYNKNITRYAPIVEFINEEGKTYYQSLQKEEYGIEIKERLDDSSVSKVRKEI